MDLSLPPASPATADGFLRRPLLDAQGALQGYELAGAGGRLTARELLQQADLPQLAKHRLLVLPATPACLDDLPLDQLPPEHLVLLVETPAGDDPAEIERLLPVLAALRARKVRLAFGMNALKKAYSAWLGLAHYIRVDLAAVAPQRLELVVSYITRQTPAKAIVTGVHSAEQLEQLRALGVTLLQGDWFSRPSATAKGVIQPSQGVLIEMINLLQRGADAHEIAPLIKRDPSLSFNLLRVINAASNGFAFEVTSLQHAVMLLGNKRLLRWAAALMAQARAPGAAPALAPVALTRGRLMELLARELLSPQDCDNAFVTGVFSLLDALLDMPMADALGSLALPEPVADALLRGQGLLAPFLVLTIACENHDDAAFARAAEELHLTGAQINWAHLQALAWADEVSTGW